VFEIAALIESPVKWEVRFIVRFLDAKGERGIYCTIRRTVRTSRPTISTCFDDDDEVQEEVMT